MVFLGDLPAELVMEIAEWCTISSVAALARTCRDLHNIATPELYRKVGRGHFAVLAQLPLYWGLKYNQIATVRQALAATGPGGKMFADAVTLGGDSLRVLRSAVSFHKAGLDTQLQYKQPEFQALGTLQLRESPLFLACGAGNVEAAKLLLDAGVRVDTPSTNRLGACKDRCFHTNIVTFLANHWGINHVSWNDLVDRCRYPLDSAVCNGNLELVKLIAAHQGTVGSGLHTAAATGSAEMVDALLSHGAADPNGRSSLDQTPLHYAVSRRKYDANTLQVVERLVRGGARIDALGIHKTMRGPMIFRTPHTGLADAQHEEAEASRLGQAHGRRFFTPLGIVLAMGAAMENATPATMLRTSLHYLPLIKLLLSLGADVNSRWARYDGHSVAIRQELWRWGSVQEQRRHSLEVGQPN